MHINGVEVEDTFAEAFKMYGSRFIISAASKKWAREAATRATGFATSVIGCGCEAGIEDEVASDETPDGRPGVSVLIFTMDTKCMEEQLVNRVGFGDGFQISKLLDRRRLWRIPVMDGEFVVEDSFGIQQAVGGGNFLILGKGLEVTLQAAEKAIEGMKGVKGVVMPFPGGIVRSGSKISSRYKFLHASTNTAFCPTIKRQIDSLLPEEVNCVLEIVIDGLDEGTVREAMRLGIKEACIPGIIRISAGNYGGKLGRYQIYLHELYS
ncbi:MAG: formylmethanofuran--tetrahydromethanopterin N-formyltransferase [Chloroflexi bacterium]|nr:formylmethanofuran--tetrahydromethanopterin N-formyltransferase [Chloroflexota bacterium]